MTLEDFISGILAGTISYPVAKYIFDVLVPHKFSSQMKRLLTYVISFVLAVAALGAGSYFGYTTVEPDTVFAAFVTAFSTATALHGLIDLGEKPAV